MFVNHYLVAVASVLLSPCWAQQGGADQQIIHSLVQNRALIERNVTETNDGVLTHTWSDDAQVASWIQTHVAQMTARLEENRGLRWWDPLFEAIFANHADLNLDVTNTSNGVFVNETGDTDCAIDLVHAHAQVVSLFIELGPTEVQSEHDAPDTCLASMASPTSATSGSTTAPSTAVPTTDSMTVAPSRASSTSAPSAADPTTDSTTIAPSTASPTQNSDPSAAATTSSSGSIIHDAVTTIATLTMVAAFNTFFF